MGATGGHVDQQLEDDDGKILKFIYKICLFFLKLCTRSGVTLLLISFLCYSEYIYEGTFVYQLISFINILHQLNTAHCQLWTASILLECF